MRAFNELESFRRALGHSPDSLRAQLALQLAGPATDESLTSNGRTNEFSRIARSGGVQMRYYDDELGAVFINTQPTESYAAYPRPDALFHSLPGDATRTEVRAELGEPVWSSPNSDRFECDGYRLQFQYGVDERTVLVVLMVPSSE